MSDRWLILFKKNECKYMSRIYLMLFKKNQGKHRSINLAPTRAIERIKEKLT